MISGWIRERRSLLKGHCDRIALSASHEWSLKDGRLEHRKRAFFSICGITAEAPGQFFDGTSFPLIDQPEIGLLAFIVTEGYSGKDWLLQAKAEPGSVEWVQVGPTVQATESNYRRRHGGAETRFLSYFTNEHGDVVGGELHSEQGTRFLNKYNRNAIVEVPSRIDPGHDNWSWHTSADLKAALAQDFMINTDARSVIATHPWRFLAEGKPLFTGPPSVAGLDDLRSRLALSYATGGDNSGQAHAVIARLEQQQRATHISLKMHSLNDLPNWTFTDDGLAADGKVAIDGFIHFYRVHAPQREREQWDQPFMGSIHSQKCALILADCDGVIKAGLRFAAEPGFRNRVQLGPSYQSDGGNTQAVAELLKREDLRPVLRVSQSDEGGRFMRLVVSYELYDLRRVDWDIESSGLAWVDLAELEWLCKRSGLLTRASSSLTESRGIHIRFEL